jgi:hypothetical protein
MLMPRTILVLSCLAISSYAAAQSPPDPARDRAELLRLHALDRKGHLRTDADLLAKGFADEMISVRDGEIHRVTKPDRRHMLAEYFRGARYQEWDDVEEPIVHVSDDGSLAWMITRVRVCRWQKDSSGVEREQKFVYAGITTYQKAKGRWMKVANVSTFEPDSGRSIDR